MKRDTPTTQERLEASLAGRPNSSCTDSLGEDAVLVAASRAFTEWIEGRLTAWLGQPASSARASITSPMR
jgi:hypothetical protein